MVRKSHAADDDLPAGDPPSAGAPAGDQPSVGAPASGKVREAQPTVDPTPLPEWVVDHGGERTVVRAASAREAWAAFCDGKKAWPSPRSGTVTKKA